MHQTLKQKWQLGEPWIEHQELQVGVQVGGDLLWLVLLDGPTLSDGEKQE